MIAPVPRKASPDTPIIMLSSFCRVACTRLQQADALHVIANTPQLLHDTMRTAGVVVNKQDAGHMVLTPMSDFDST